MRNDIVGTCGICGGRVLGYGIWMSVTPPPPPSCESCGAEVASHGPVLDMRPTNHRVYSSAKIVWTKTHE